MIRTLSTDSASDRAVSPVIGVILMVAITVILAAVVGAFVMQTGTDTKKAPQASFSFDYQDASSAITISHAGGEKLDRSTLTVKVDGSSAAASDLDWHSNSELTAGDQVDVAASAAGGSWSSGDTVEVVWTAQSGDSAVLATFEVP